MRLFIKSIETFENVLGNTYRCKLINPIRRVEGSLTYRDDKLIDYDVQEIWIHEDILYTMPENRFVQTARASIIDMTGYLLDISKPRFNRQGYMLNPPKVWVVDKLFKDFRLSDIRAQALKNLEEYKKQYLSR